ncbi:hypothetical protein [Sphingomonas bacterium]|uniref:hypothetical protein n=1 Tax=Sphingomonas bacterium TaxID=1895847 RepID=UPI001577184B|nr:hypothetical protein [Sphingomonas bacterium]
MPIIGIFEKTGNACTGAITHAQRQAEGVRIAPEENRVSEDVPSHGISGIVYDTCRP